MLNSMIASLPMYDLPEIRWATDQFWAALAEELKVEIPLTRTGDFKETWRSPDLLFSQTCGYPFTHEFAGQLAYVATPHYDADGCEGPLYRSILFAREAKPIAAFAKAKAAFNSTDSMSGFLALKLVMRQQLPQLIETGSHVASLAAVQNGDADICAIDCVTVALLRKHRPAALEGLVEVARSPLVPALPFVTRVADRQRLYDALHAVPQNQRLSDCRQALLLQSFSVLPQNAYDVIPDLERGLS
jgi:ABC-type phosphate/phosphonate transport system substrate-binding protein